MSDLTATRDHCRRMATAVHTDDCLIKPTTWGKAKPRPGCRGCVSDADRVLWAQLAGEIDRYLAADADVVAVPTFDDAPLEGL